ncbi:hypothetical protein LG198_07815 [Methylobacillus arboreus]|uniref:hypothetical protein n=1 Tax=Methylobacillus arboreus TaxID=755170 RepID=UPI001E657E4C|nr:hypothetical protein [Methylobacillus arboreus]MCB5190628.1 hypothetical protein [Methylobacillus arboreus]
MSPSWLDRMLPSWLRPTLVLHIYPDHIVWVRTAAGLKRRIENRGVFQFEAESSGAQAVLAALPQVLQQADAAGARVEVVLSSHFMRYAIVPNPDGAAGGGELALLCRHAFERVHGEAASRWDIRLSFAALGGNGIASAVDRDLLDGLWHQSAVSGALLASVQSGLARAFNQLKKPQPDGIFVLAEPGRLCLLAWQARSWTAVQLQPALPDWQDGLDARLARLRLQLDMPDTVPVHVCARTGEDIDLRIVPWSVDHETGLAMAGGKA